MLGNICAARDQLAIVPFAVYPVLAVSWMAIRRATLREVQDISAGYPDDLLVLNAVRFTQGIFGNDPSHH